jgi:hypothetical protein
VSYIIIIIIYLLLLLLTAIGFSPDGSSPYTSTHNTNGHINIHKNNNILLYYVNQSVDNSTTTVHVPLQSIISQQTMIQYNSSTFTCTVEVCCADCSSVLLYWIVDATERNNIDYK